MTLRREKFNGNPVNLLGLSLHGSNDLEAVVAVCQQKPPAHVSASTAAMTLRRVENPIDDAQLVRVSASTEAMTLRRRGIHTM